jgi:hypothetical protein
MSDAHRESATEMLQGLDDGLGRVLGGHGSGLPCAHCREVIHAHELEYEIIEPTDGPGPTSQQPTDRLHLRCYESWRARRGGFGG